MSYIIYQRKRLGFNYSPKKIEGLICFGTDEDRSLNVIKHLYQIGKLPNLVFVLGTTREEKNSNKFSRLFPGIDFCYFNIEEDMSIRIIDCLKSINQYVAFKNIIGIDISGMPVPIFTQILHFLFENYKKCN